MHFNTSVIAAAVAALVAGGASASGANVQAVASETDPIVALFDCATGEAIVDGRPEGRALTDAELELAAYGFCQLRQYSTGAYYCEQGTCVGSCRLNNYPLSCSCR